MFGYVTIKEVLYFRYQMAQLDFPLYCEALLEYIYIYVVMYRLWHVCF